MHITVSSRIVALLHVVVLVSLSCVTSESHRLEPQVIDTTDSPGHSAGVLAVDVTDDGKYIVTANAQGIAILWDARTADELRRFHAGGSIVSIAVSNRGFFVTASDEGVIFWDMESGDSIRTLTLGHQMPTSVALSTDETELVVGWTDGTARVHGRRRFREVAVLHASDGGVQDVAFSPDGTQILTASSKGIATLWDVQSEQPLLELVTRAGPINRVAFSPCGRTVATSGYEGPIILWDVTTGQKLHVFEDGFRTVRSLAFSQFGEMLLTGDSNGIRLWNVYYQRAWGATKEYGVIGGINDAVFGADGVTILLGGANGVSYLITEHRYKVLQTY